MRYSSLAGSEGRSQYGFWQTVLIPHFLIRFTKTSRLLWSCGSNNGPRRLNIISRRLEYAWESYEKAKNKK